MYAIRGNYSGGPQQRPLSRGVPGPLRGAEPHGRPPGEVGTADFTSLSQRGGVGPRYTSQPTNRPCLRASPPAARTLRVLRPVPESGTSGHWAPRATTRARPCPSHAEPQHHPGLGQSRRRPTRSPRRGGATRGGAATTWHRLSFSTPPPLTGGAGTRRGPSAPALPSATRRGGRTHRYAEPRSPPEIAGLPPRGAIFGPLVQRGASGTDERGVS